MSTTMKAASLNAKSIVPSTLQQPHGNVSEQKVSSVANHAISSHFPRKVLSAQECAQKILRYKNISWIKSSIVGVIVMCLAYILLRVLRDKEPKDYSWSTKNTNIEDFCLVLRLGATASFFYLLFFRRKYTNVMIIQ